MNGPVVAHETLGKCSQCFQVYGSGPFVSKVFPNTKDFICHFHFLRDVGKDFLEPAYGRLRKRLRKHATSTALNYQARQMKKALQEEGIEGHALK